MYLKSPTESYYLNSVIVNSGIVITPSSSCIVVNFTEENMSSDQSSQVKYKNGFSKIVRKTLGIEQLS